MKAMNVDRAVDLELRISKLLVGENMEVVVNVLLNLMATMILAAPAENHNDALDYMFNALKECVACAAQAPTTDTMQ